MGQGRDLKNSAISPMSATYWHSRLKTQQQQRHRRQSIGGGSSRAAAGQQRPQSPRAQQGILLTAQLAICRAGQGRSAARPHTGLAVAAAVGRNASPAAGEGPVSGACREGGGVADRARGASGVECHSSHAVCCAGVEPSQCTVGGRGTGHLPAAAAQRADRQLKPLGEPRRRLDGCGSSGGARSFGLHDRSAGCWHHKA